MAGTRKKRETPLSTDEIFERALRMVDVEGLGALTMRRLAEDAGVEAASLYYHVPNKEALLEGVLIRMRGEMRLPDPMPSDWRDMMERIFAEYRRVLTAHPNLLPLAGRRVEGDPSSGLLYLIQIGFSQDDAVALWQSMMAYVVGFSMFSSPQGETDTSDLPSDLAARMRDWRDETCAATLRMIIDGYERRRAEPGKGRTRDRAGDRPRGETSK